MIVTGLANAKLFFTSLPPAHVLILCESTGQEEVQVFLDWISGFNPNIM